MLLPVLFSFGLAALGHPAVPAQPDGEGPSPEHRLNTYAATVESLAKRRRDYAAEYRRDSNPRSRAAVLRRARRDVLRTLTEELAPAWYGTPWRYSGRTEMPQQGAIACGTFVATLLQHAGFRLNRIAMGRLASEHIALSLTSNANVRRYSNRPGDEVARDVEAWGEGLYLLGLDYHAALVHVDPRGVSWVIHSSYYVDKVVAERLRAEMGFQISRYRVVAKLLDDTMVRSWLTGRRFEARDRR